ncbi:Myosin head (motor domain) [Phytophthora infestans]|uniref:Myosin head (Motor domain) n=1 Tax=Phytophthora infestans TaxID=4787 RepID=A0A8S9UNW6_PHYIN|nr:Myosin head (motor domain) [Phytophthora infestans]
MLDTQSRSHQIADLEDYSTPDDLAIVDADNTKRQKRFQIALVNAYETRSLGQGLASGRIFNRSTPHPFSIGIFNIYGFEILRMNALEQLCINYVSEKSSSARSKQEEFRREGLSWRNVKFFNNHIIWDLIDDLKQHGISPLLDGHCESLGPGAH